MLAETKQKKTEAAGADPQPLPQSPQTASSLGARALFDQMTAMKQLRQAA